MPSFGIRGRTGPRKLFFTLHASLFSILSIIKKLHNIMTEWLNDTNVELVPNDLSL